ncbi:MAG: hypothetical protein R3212_12395, partial [Xanthomonadales bacterium]|nr:hypothetical protein [Xanthomonadales bacterium]
MTLTRRLQAAAACTILCWCKTTVAGPPLNMDDPGILEPGQWELILAAVQWGLDSGDLLEAPVLDASLGVSANSQVSFVLPYVIDNPFGEPGRSGLGFASVGYKWRFWSGEDSEWAIAPGLSFPVGHDLVERDSPDDVNVAGIPLLYSKTSGDWTFLGQLSWYRDSGGARAWDYAVSASRPLTPSTL